MQWKYLRITTFYALLLPYSKRARSKRMQLFAALIGVREGMRILDLGGQPMIWDSIDDKLNLTIVNLPGIANQSVPSHHAIRYLEADACDLRNLDEGPFDVVFSNSVIEHVGAADRRQAFAAEARRLGKSYWVQTPSSWFPIEAHCGMPFWWLYPAPVRQFFLKRWRKNLPNWTRMVEETTVLSKAELQQLFPEAAILTERSLGIAKSYVAWFAGEMSAPRP
jgi:hypothetical protein